MWFLTVFSLMNSSLAISRLFSPLATSLSTSTPRLTDSAVVLSSDGKGPDLAMQRLMRRAGRSMMPAKPVLEINPRHTLIEALSARLVDSALIAEAAETLLDLAHVQEGDLPADTTAFARRVTTLLAGSLG